MQSKWHLDTVTLRFQVFSALNDEWKYCANTDAMEGSFYEKRYFRHWIKRIFIEKKNTKQLQFSLQKLGMLSHISQIASILRIMIPSELSGQSNRKGIRHNFIAESPLKKIIKSQKKIFVDWINLIHFSTRQKSPTVGWKHYLIKVFVRKLLFLSRNYQITKSRHLFISLQSYVKRSNRYSVSLEQQIFSQHHRYFQHLDFARQLISKKFTKIIARNRLQRQWARRLVQKDRALA